MHSRTDKIKVMLAASLRRSASLLLLLCVLTTALVAARNETPAGTIISNRADATYQDETGTTYTTVSQTVKVIVLAVPAISVTPDETIPSAATAPDQNITRQFNICNTGNADDHFLPTAAVISTPATISDIYFDSDGSGTVTSGDLPVTLGETRTPLLSPGTCYGVLVVIATNNVSPQSNLTITLTARSTTGLPNGSFATDIGRIINSVGQGVIFTSPDNSELSPVKLVENRARITAVAGQIVDYTIAFRNRGSVAARQVRVNDDLPAELEYTPHTLRLNDRNLTDAADADEGSATMRRIELLIPEIAPDAVTEIKFRARVKGDGPNGAAVVNFATVDAANAPFANTSNAVVVLNPVGTVYAGNSAGSVRIPGARITIATDDIGTPLDTVDDIGYVPNLENVNPFVTDSNGGFSFVISGDQVGNAGNPRRYVVTVNAANYQPRMIEVRVESNGSDSFYTATIRSLDGQPISAANSFELTSDAIRLSDLAALVFNIPMFEDSILEISKSADKQFAEIGDIVTYRIQVRNASVSPIRELTVRDNLPPTFVYAAGTARSESGTDSTNVEPTVNGSELIFRLPELGVGMNAVISYRVRIGANTREGDHVNSAVAIGLLSSGDTLATLPAKSIVRVRGGAFSMRQIVIGRVFEDRNNNGQFDAGERPVSGARVYTNNGQSVVTDTAGNYNLPAVSPGSLVLSLDPVTLPAGYNLMDDGGRRSSKSWTRLLRTPIGGGALLRQNFAVAASSDAAVVPASFKVISAAGVFMPEGQEVSVDPRPSTTSNEKKTPLAQGPRFVSEEGSVAIAKPQSETFTVEATETIASVSPGDLLIVSPKSDEVIMTAALAITASVAKDWSIEAVVNGEKIGMSNVGETRIDNRNQIVTLLFVGISIRPGINTLKLTAIGPNAERGRTSEIKVFGRGAVERLEVVPAKNGAKAGGADSVKVEIRGFDRQGNPAADGPVSVETTVGKLHVVRSSQIAADSAAEPARQQMVSLEGGIATIHLIGDGSADMARIKAIAGRHEATADIRFTAELRPTLMVGLAEYSVGRNAPEISSTGDDERVRGRTAFYYRGKFFGENLLTLAYDSRQALNRVAGRDRFGGFDPLDRSYAIFGDSSQRFEDAESNSKVYARLDRGRSFVMFGDIEPHVSQPALTGYGRRLTGAKVHLESSAGNFISVTGARPDTAFARDVFPGGTSSIIRLSHRDILQGSESVAIEIRDRRNPENIISRELLIRSVDYNLDPQTGEVFFMRPISTFDQLLNLVQIVVTYEHRGAGSSNYVYTGRAVQNFSSLGLKVGASYINQQQDQIGAFQLGGVDLEKSLPKGGILKFESAVSRGRFASGINVFDFYNDNFAAGSDDMSAREHNGIAAKVMLDQPLPFFHSRIVADFQRASAKFYNPFGATVAPGSQRLSIALEMRPSAKRSLTFGFVDEKNETSNVDNSRQTFSAVWGEQWRDNLRTVVGFDHRRFNDELSDRDVNSNLLTVAVEYRPTSKLDLSIKREQNLGEADQTYPDQTTLAANYQLNPNAKLFFTQRLASAPITPIGDLSNTGFAAVGSRRETAFGIETKISRLGALSGRYQLENGVNGTDSFAVIGLQNRWTVTNTIAVEGGFERGFLVKGAGSSFNSATVGASWTPVEGFRASGRYELRDRRGLGHLLSLGAAGKIGDNWTTMARAQWAQTSFNSRTASSSTVTAAAAYRPLESDRYALLFSYNHATREQSASEFNGIRQDALKDRSSTLSSDGLFQVNRNLELYGRFALRFNGNGGQATAYASALTYQAQFRAQHRLSDRMDLAAEFRALSQSASGTFRRSAGIEAGYWLTPDLRFGGGYNFTHASRTNSFDLDNDRRFRGGFYFTITTKLSNIFNLLGTSNKGLSNSVTADDQEPATQNSKNGGSNK